MSGRDGFSLVELIVVIVIFGFFMALGSPAFSTWQKKHTVEDQIEKLYSNLQFARMKAYAEKVTWGVWWGATTSSTTTSFNRYEIRRDKNLDGDITDANETNPQSAVSLKYPVTGSIKIFISMEEDSPQIGLLFISLPVLAPISTASPSRGQESGLEE